MEHIGNERSQWYADRAHPNLSVNTVSKITHGNHTFFYTGTFSTVQTYADALKQFQGRVDDFTEAGYATLITLLDGRFELFATPQTKKTFFIDYEGENIPTKLQIEYALETANIDDQGTLEVIEKIELPIFKEPQK